MISPRNTLVVLDIIEKEAEKIGRIHIPTNGDLYAEAEVLAVGPGTVQAQGGVSETFDLKVGQRVLVKAKEHRGGPNAAPSIAGIRIKMGEKFCYIYEQLSIIGIIGEQSKSNESLTL